MLGVCLLGRKIQQKTFRKNVKVYNTLLLQNDFK